LNLYGYVLGNPINTSDPLGLFTLSGTVGSGLGINVHLGVNGGQFQWGIALGAAGGASVDFDFTDSGCRSEDGELFIQGKGAAGHPLYGGAGAEAMLAFELNNSGNARFDVSGSGTVGYTSYGGSATHVKGKGWQKPSATAGKSIPLGKKDFHPRSGASGFLGVGLKDAHNLGKKKCSTKLP